MTDTPIIRRARKGEVRCAECKHYKSVGVAYSIRPGIWTYGDKYVCTAIRPHMDTFSDNTCDHAEKRR